MSTFEWSSRFHQPIAVKKMDTRYEKANLFAVGEYSATLTEKWKLKFCNNDVAHAILSLSHVELKNFPSY